MTLEEALPIVTATATAVGILDFLIRKWLQKHRDELILALNSQITQLRTEVAGSVAECAKVKGELKESEDDRTAKTAALVVTKHRIVTLEEEAKARATQLGELQDVKATLDQEQKTHDNRIRGR